MDRAEVPDCDSCTAFEENPREFAEREVCPACPWGRQVDNPVLTKLLHYLDLQEAGCPLGRHELMDNEWKALLALKNERARIWALKHPKD